MIEIVLPSVDSRTEIEMKVGEDVEEGKTMNISPNDFKMVTY
jgi:hypothetical protein